MFENYPHKTHEALFKTYYLLQGSYWAQQALVLMLQLEKPRKDFKELVGHHIITLLLISLSYIFHFTHMGLVVYITHDISDFFIAVSIPYSLVAAQATMPLPYLLLLSIHSAFNIINVPVLSLTLTCPFLDLENTQLH
jgi:acyl-CoA-dependent ceramide synthase